jgi:beta-glucanase (GH16 family)
MPALHIRGNIIHYQLRIFFLLMTSITTLNGQVLIEFKGDEKTMYTYIGGDEFTGEGLNKEKWMTSYPWARHLYCSMDVNYYSDGDDLQQQGGILSITARKSKITARAIPYESDSFLLRCPDKPTVSNLMTFDYQSGLIYSKEKYTYGLFEIRFRTDATSGLWPAFWLFGADNQEIDIFEMGGSRAGAFHVDVHCKKGCKNYPVFLGLLRKNWGDHLYTTADWKNNFHTISIDWREEGITWYLDGLPVAWWKGTFSDPLALIANLAVTNKEGSIGGAITGSTLFPAKFDIDYIRIWQKDDRQNYLFEKSVHASPFRELLQDNKNSEAATLTKKKRPEYKRKIIKTPVQRIGIFRESADKLLVSMEGNKSVTAMIELNKKGSPAVQQQHEIKNGTSLLPLSGPGIYTIKVKCADQMSEVRIEVQ